MTRPSIWLRLYEAALSRPGKAEADQANIARRAAITADYALQEYEERIKYRMKPQRLRKDSEE